MIGFCPLSSGSKGNCLYLGSKNTKILIDAGVSLKLIIKRLQEIGVGIDQIDAILVSHEHMDHIRGLALLSKKHHIPILANSETAKGIYQSIRFKPKFKIFTTGEPFEFGDIEIFPFGVQHDTLDPVAFTIKIGNVKLGICTDLGFVTSIVKKELQGCDYLYLEANHQPSMVYASNRPNIYKQRVLGRQGHISNEECANLLLDIHHSNLKHVHLAHLSKECNSEELALKIVKEKLSSKKNMPEISIAYQEKISKAVSLE